MILAGTTRILALSILEPKKNLFTIGCTNLSYKDFFYRSYIALKVGTINNLHWGVVAGPAL